MLVDSVPQYMQNLQMARDVLAGREGGVVSHPGQFSPGVISLADGEGMRRPHPSVVAAAIEALYDTEICSLEKYSFQKRYEPLDHAIATQFIQAGVDESVANNICLSSGTSNLFNAFFATVSKPNEVYLTAPGFYHSLASWCFINSIRLEVVPPDPSTEFKLTREAMEQWRNRHPHLALRGLIIFNPTYCGAVYSHDELKEIAEFVDNNDLVVIEDILFSATEYEPAHTKAEHLSAVGVPDRVVTVNGPSKAYGLANVRVGWAVGPKQIIDRMNFYVGATQVDVPHIAKAMALAALNGPDKYLIDNARELHTRANLVAKLVAKVNKTLQQKFALNPSVPVIKILAMPRAGHSILLSLNSINGLQMGSSPGTIINSINVTRLFLKDASVCVSPGLSMGFTDSTIRIAFGCVGVNRTYDATNRSIELAAGYDALGRIAGDTTFLQTARSISPTPAFHAGQQLIIEGFSRMSDALCMLIESNGSHTLKGDC